MCAAARCFLSVSLLLIQSGKRRENLAESGVLLNLTPLDDSK